VSSEPPPSAGRTHSGDHARFQPGVWLDPRRSLGARLLWTLLPIVFLPAALYWIAADRLLARSEAEITTILREEAAERERANLQRYSDARLAQLREQSARIRAVLAEATVEAARALEAGPLAGLPAEELTAGRGGSMGAVSAASAVLVSRATGLTPAARRDVAATRRLEADFTPLVAGHHDIPEAYVMTASGVLRAVPGRDLAKFSPGVMPADFRFPSRWAARLVQGAADERNEGVVWTDVYDDAYSQRGRVVSAVALIRSRRGDVLGEVGVDWVYSGLFVGGAGLRRPDESEVVFTADGRTVAFSAAVALTEADIGLLETRTSSRGEGILEIELSGVPYLAAVRRVPGLSWTYIRLIPLPVAFRAVEAQARTIFAAGAERRRELRAVYLTVMVLLGGLIVAVTHRTMDPIRRLARVADAITGGPAAAPLPEETRGDEVGRFSRALANLDERIRRRIRSMEGMHRLALAASSMTRPEETYARLTRQIAETVGAKKSWLCLWDPETRALVLTPPGYGVPDEALRGRRLGLADGSLSILCYRSSETYLQNDVYSDPRASHGLARDLGIEKSIVLAPLRTEVGTLGVLAVADKPEGFDAEDQASIESYSDQAALLLRNARLYEELQKSYERLRDAQRNRDYFLQNINHELRTPLTAILGWSEVLAEDKPDRETVVSAVEQIRRSAQFLLALISDLLDLSRFDEGRTRLEPELVDVATLVSESVEPVSVMAEGKGVSLTVSTPPKGEAGVLVDPIRMRQVLWNLVHNAVKFTARGGRIEVGATVDDAGVSFSVADTGVGIDRKDLPFIFERFRQADGSNTRAYRGMGIGLALAKAYVELHGGSIRVESQPGRGTLFRIRIPKISPSGPIPAVPPAEEGGGGPTP
jgi:signal transduction histidine kinase/HAMP domain-containing protein